MAWTHFIPLKSNIRRKTFARIFFLKNKKKKKFMENLLIKNLFDKSLIMLKYIIFITFELVARLLLNQYATWRDSSGSGAGTADAADAAAGRKPEFKWFEWFCLKYHIQYETRRINLCENLHFIQQCMPWHCTEQIGCIASGSFSQKIQIEKFNIFHIILGERTKYTNRLWWYMLFDFVLKSSVNFGHKSCLLGF